MAGLDCKQLELREEGGVPAMSLSVKSWPFSHFILDWGKLWFKRKTTGPGVRTPGSCSGSLAINPLPLAVHPPPQASVCFTFLQNIL